MRWIQKWAARLLAVSVAGLLLLMAAGFVLQNVATARDLATNPPPGALVTVGGKRMHIHCLGTGSPTVLLDTGLTASGAAWGPIQRAVAATTRTCTYDRSGLGHSEHLGRPVPSRETAQRLHALLGAAGEGEPVVFVGASAGGLTGRSLYSQFPERVAGMVLLDSSHERYNEAFGKTEARSPPLPIRLGAWIQPLGLVRLAGLVGADIKNDTRLSVDDRNQLLTTYEQSHTAQAVADEFRAFDMDMLAGREPPSLGDLPLLVLSQGAPVRRDDDSDEDWAERLHDHEVWNGLQAGLAATSTRGEWRVVEGSGHIIGMDAPDVTIAAIVEMVETCRRE